MIRYVFYFCHECGAPVDVMDETCKNCGSEGNAMTWLKGIFDKNASNQFNQVARIYEEEPGA